jgi:5,10-methylenetetrahydromethanopterin reductase
VADERAIPVGWLLTPGKSDIREAVAHVARLEERGFERVWMGEAWREVIVQLGAMAERTSTIGLSSGILQIYPVNPVMIAQQAAQLWELSEKRFKLGLGLGAGFVIERWFGVPYERPLRRMREFLEVVRGVLRAPADGPFSYEGEIFRVHKYTLPFMEEPADVPLYMAAIGPQMQQLAGEIADGCLTPSITTPAFVRYSRDNVGGDIDLGCTVVASIHESDRAAGRDGAREIAGMYLANKVQNIQGSADTLLDLAGIEQEEIRPVAEAMEQGGRLAAKALVTDTLLDKCKPIAGTPDDCIAAIEEYREAGCTHVMLELWGAKRHEQIRLFGERVLPHFRQ